MDARASPPPTTGDAVADHGDGDAQRVRDRMPLRELGHGRTAQHPLQIGLRGWFDIFMRLVERVGVDNLGLVTAGVTFYLFLALIPALIAVATFYGVYADSVTLASHVDFLAGYLPDQAILWLEGEVERVSNLSSDGLNVTLAISLFLSFWAMNNAVMALFGAMNVAYGEIEKRSILAIYLRGFMVTGGALVLGLALVSVIVVAPIVFGSTFHTWHGRGPFLTAPMLFAVVALSSAAIFRLGPSRRPAQWRWIAVGAVMVALGWLAASTLLSWYLSDVADYSRLYGSLGTVIALMFWFFVSVYILLLGAELNAEIEHQTMVDTTTGPSRPEGRRGAYVADTVGRTYSLF